MALNHRAFEPEDKDHANKPSDWPPPIPQSPITEPAQRHDFMFALGMIAQGFATVVPLGIGCLWILAANLRLLPPGLTDVLIADIACGVFFLASFVCGCIARRTLAARIAIFMAVCGLAVTAYAAFVLIWCIGEDNTMP